MTQSRMVFTISAATAPVSCSDVSCAKTSSNDGACEVELKSPPGKLGHVLHIDVFTASGRIGSTTALLAP